jgi:molybdopterin-guanine dinucleotide biosynthesis protein A
MNSTPDLIQDCTGIILAGGENRRMPVLKAFIKINGKKIIERNLTIFKRLFKEVFIVTNQPNLYVYLGIPLLGDIYTIRGPMTGIFTSLVNASHHWVFVTACDMPFINPALIRHITSQRNGHDAVLPQLKDTSEPLFACYSKRLIPSMEKAILSGRTSLQDFLTNKRVKYILEKEIRKIDHKRASFININTPEDAAYYLNHKGVSKN